MPLCIVRQSFDAVIRCRRSASQFCAATTIGAEPLTQSPPSEAGPGSSVPTAESEARGSKQGALRAGHGLPPEGSVREEVDETCGPVADITRSAAPRSGMRTGAVSRACEQQRGWRGSEDRWCRRSLLLN
jgi:hypothetical protein